VFCSKTPIYRILPLRTSPYASTNNTTQWALLLPPHPTIEGVGRVTTPFRVSNCWSSKSPNPQPSDHRRRILSSFYNWTYYSLLRYNYEHATRLYGLWLCGNDRPETFAPVLGARRWFIPFQTQSNHRPYLQPSSSRSTEEEKGE